MQLPVFIAIPGTANTVAPGLVRELSRTGMKLYGEVSLQPGELMEVEIRTNGQTIRLAGIVRNRSGFCFGLEFCAAQIDNTRRCPRYHMRVPVFITVPEATDTVVPGLVSELSRSGMELYAGVNLQPGDLMEVEFRTAGRTIRVTCIVRNRSGFCYGLEFCALCTEPENASRSSLEVTAI